MSNPVFLFSASFPLPFFIVRDFPENLVDFIKITGILGFMIGVE